MKGLSLERKLPLLMTAVLVVVLAAAVLVLDREVRRSTSVLVTHQLQQKAQTLGKLIDPTASIHANAFRPVARDR